MAVDLLDLLTMVGAIVLEEGSAASPWTRGTGSRCRQQKRPCTFHHRDLDVRETTMTIVSSLYLDQSCLIDVERVCMLFLVLASVPVHLHLHSHSPFCLT